MTKEALQLKVKRQRGSARTHKKRTVNAALGGAASAGSAAKRPRRRRGVVGREVRKQMEDSWKLELDKQGELMERYYDMVMGDDGERLALAASGTPNASTASLQATQVT